MSRVHAVTHRDRLRVVSGLFEPRPLVYWTDFVASALLGWAAFALAYVSSSVPMTVVAAALSALALYRAVLFTHELVHLGRDRIRGFRTAWNALCGVPLLVPSFLYDGVHQEHHFRRNYGTAADGEYLPFGQPPRLRVLMYLVSHAALPPLMALRFGVLGPISWLSARWRRFVWGRMSSLSIDPRYGRKVPDRTPASWVLQESLCTVYVWSAALLLATGLLQTSFILTLYVVSVLILVLNAVRTLAAHRYAGHGEPMSFDEQLADSVNIAGGLATPLLAPVGLRFHALHHLFPTMPYHNLAEAHRRMISQLPRDQVYLSTIAGSLTQALRELWASSAQRGAAAAPESPQAESASRNRLLVRR